MSYGIFGGDDEDEDNGSTLEEDLAEVDRMDEDAQNDPEGHDNYTELIDQQNASEFPDGDGEI